LTLFLDYDGTLVPIAPRPEDAVPSLELVDTLSALASRMMLAIVSGRMIRDLRSLLPIRGVVFAGVHGAEVLWADGRSEVLVDSDRIRPILDEVKQKLRRPLEALEGILLEDKVLSLALHYRLASSEDADRACRAFREIARERRAEGLMEVLEGRKVLVLKPAALNKGTVVRRILDELRRDEACAAFFGDDVGDEPAFAVLRERGITVLVSREENRSTKAEYRFEGPEEVHAVLQAILEGCDEEKSK
jgi:trehalose 6-phosphate phosphatase